MRSTFCAHGRLTSRLTPSRRGTMNEPIWRSSRRNTLRTMSCSSSSIAPDSEPSTSRAWISSSVTGRACASWMPSARSTSRVEPASSATNGRVKRARSSMGRARRRATASGSSWPRRLGTSSPSTIEKYVISTTTAAVAAYSTNLPSRPRPFSHSTRTGASAASPTMPFRMPIEVMPIWMVERNCVGPSCRRSAACAPASPSAASGCRRPLRAAMSAISDMAKAPFSRIRANRIATSMAGFPRRARRITRAVRDTRALRDHPNLQRAGNRLDLDARLRDGAEELEARVGRLELGAACIEQLEQSGAPKPVGRLGHFEESRVAAAQAFERRAPRTQCLQVALKLGAQDRLDRALAAARRRRLRPCLVLLRAPRVEDRDLARYAEEVRRTERPAGPGAPDANARYRKALALRELDARLGGAGLRASGLQRRAPVEQRVGVDRRRRPQRLEGTLRLRPPAAGPGECRDRRGVLGDLRLSFLHCDRSERQLGVGACEVIAACHAVLETAGNDAADALDLPARAQAGGELLLRDEQPHELERGALPRLAHGRLHLPPRALDLPLGHLHTRAALSEDRHGQLERRLVLQIGVEDRPLAAGGTRAPDGEARVGKRAGGIALGARRVRIP